MSHGKLNGNFFTTDIFSNDLEGNGHTRSSIGAVFIRTCICWGLCVVYNVYFGFVGIIIIIIIMITTTTTITIMITGSVPGARLGW